jgi:alanine racemase
MPGSPHVRVEVDLERIRRNIADVRSRIGRAELHAVVKADAYGLGAQRVADAIRGLVDGFVVFYPGEAETYGLTRWGKPVLALGPAGDDSVPPGVRPAVWTVEQAAALRAAGPVLSVDTGMQRFACPPERIERVVQAGGCREAFTHATRVEAVRRLVQLVGGRGMRLHAAGTALLPEPEAHLDLVRPGLALYRGAVKVSTRLVEARDTNGPAGYTGFVARRHGVILVGYSNGLRPGPCLVGGRRRRIPEVGMQSAFVELDTDDDAREEVVLLGASSGGGEVLREEEIATAWRCTPHEALFQLAGSGARDAV